MAAWHTDDQQVPRFLVYLSLYVGSNIVSLAIYSYDDGGLKISPPQAYARVDVGTGDVKFSTLQTHRSICRNKPVKTNVWTCKLEFGSWSYSQTQMDVFQDSPQIIRNAKVGRYLRVAYLTYRP